MLTGRVPFEGETVNEVLMKHLTARPDVSTLAEPYRSIVAKALAKDPNHRPSRVYDLLPPEDAPRSPDVRIIGDGKARPEHVRRAPPDDDVLRIEAEEPIFYIGPETRPPCAATAGIKQRIRANLDALRRPGVYPVRNQPLQPLAAARQLANGVVRKANLRSCRTSPSRFAGRLRLRSLPVPSGRVRLAELTSSMLWAAPLLGLLTGSRRRS